MEPCPFPPFWQRRQPALLHRTIRLMSEPVSAMLASGICSAKRSLFSVNWKTLFSFIYSYERYCLPRLGVNPNNERREILAEWLIRGRVASQLRPWAGGISLPNPDQKVQNSSLVFLGAKTRLGRQENQLVDRAQAQLEQAVLPVHLIFMILPTPGTMK